MRTLPKNKSDKQKIIIEACHDYYGKGQNEKRANQVALYLMGRKRDVELTEEEMSDLWKIKENLKDEIYLKSLV